eukprot:2014064-Prymnesium_polylepis.1
MAIRQGTKRTATKKTAAVVQGAQGGAMRLGRRTTERTRMRARLGGRGHDASSDSKRCDGE